MRRCIISVLHHCMKIFSLLLAQPKPNMYKLNYTGLMQLNQIWDSHLHVGWIRNILSTWWIVPFCWNPWQYKKLWSCSRSSAWRSNVRSFVVWSWWSLWLGYISPWCWIHFWAGIFICLMKVLVSFLPRLANSAFYYAYLFSRTYQSNSTTTTI